MSASANIQQWLNGMGQARARAIPAAEKAMMKFANHVIGEAARLAPIGGGIYSPNDPQPGLLRSSQVVLPAENQGGKITVTVGFNTIYAARQHEDLNFRHDDGQAKYLETAMRANQGKLESFVKSEVNKALS